MRAILFATIAALAAATSASAADSNNLNFLITPASYSGCSDPTFDWIDPGACGDLTSVPVPGVAFVWIVASGERNPFDIGAVQFGISHTADVNAWSLCTGGSEIPQTGWPATGRGNAVTFSGGCYVSDGENARVGFMSVTDGASGQYTFIPDPRSGDLVFTNCLAEAIDYEAEALGQLFASTGGDPTCSGCIPPPPATNCEAGAIACAIEVTWDHPGSPEDFTFDVRRNGSIVGNAPCTARSYLDVGASAIHEYTVQGFGSSATV